MDKSIQETKELAETVYDTSLDGITMALALTVALAWYALVKKTVNTVLPSKEGMWAMLGYAVVMTILFAVVVAFIKKGLGGHVYDRPVLYTVAQPML